jgi:hypothetical protein
MASLIDHKVQVEDIGEFASGAFLAFHPDGDRFLIGERTKQRCEINRYTLPGLARASTVVVPEGGGDDRLDCRACFVGDDHALVESRDNRLILVDLRRGAVVDEVSVAGQQELWHCLPLGDGLFVSVHGAADGSGCALVTWRYRPA